MANTLTFHITIYFLGPKPNTLGDFWRMIWQQDVTTIVMLTNLKEGDKVRMFLYFIICNWPMFLNLITYQTEFLYQ